MKQTLLVLFFLVLANHTSALSPLPTNSYLKLGDNQKEVKLLQQILNSDQDTEVDDTGVGSPGNENWYFGEMTEQALKRFQGKNNLETTGRIDFKTWKKINDYVLGNSNTLPSKMGGSADTNSINSKIQTADEKRLSINEQNKKDFEEAKKLKAEKKLAEIETKKEESKSFIQNLMDKYTGFFSTGKVETEKDKEYKTGSSTQDIYSNSPSSQTPYLNPNTGIYSSNPNQASQPVQTQPATGQTPYSQLFGTQSPYASQQGNPYSNLNAPGYYASQAPFTQPGTAFTTSRWGGSGTGNGFGQVVTTVYGHMRNGGSDALDNGLTACGQNSRLGGNGSKAISLKKSLRISIFGNVPKSVWCGKEIEITNPRTGRCGVYPILEEGPQEHLQAAMDMTGTVWNELDPERRDGSKNWFRFKVLKVGEKGCGK